MKILARIAHGAAVALLGLGAGQLILAQVVVPLAAVIAASEKTTQAMGIYRLIVAGMWIVWPLVAIGCAIAIWKRLRWRIVAPALLLVGCALAYLVWDDRRKPELADLGPRVTPADAGYQTVKWLSRDPRYGRLGEMRLTPEMAAAIRLPDEKESWPEHVARHREEIRLAWEQDRLGREWIDAVNARPPRGTCPVFDAGGDSSLAEWTPLQSLVWCRTARVYSLAADGRRDEAIDTLVPLIAATYELQCAGPGALNAAYATAVLRETYAVVDAVLGLGAISSEARGRLTAALRQAPPVEQIFRNAFLGEQEMLRAALGDPLRESRRRAGAGLAVLRLPVFPYSGLLLNRNRTEREWLEARGQICRLAASRQLGALRSLDERRKAGASVPRLWLTKNPLGRLASGLLESQAPSSWMAGEIWQAEDARVALLQRLEIP